MSARDAISRVSLPWLFDRTTNRHLAICGPRTGGAAMLNHLVGQVLAQSQAGTVRFLFIDHADLGGTFRSFAALGDASGEVIGSGIAARPEDIRKRLGQMIEAITDIKQGKLRDIHPSLDAYNASVRKSSGASGEPYRFVVIANWPHGFDSESCGLLKQVLDNGAPCGVHVFGSIDVAAKLPYDVKVEEIWASAARVDLGQGQAGGPLVASGLRAEPIGAMGAQQLAGIVARHGAGLSKAKTAAYGLRTMLDGVYRSNMAPYQNLPSIWGGSSVDELVIPIGLAGGERIESVVIGKGGGSSEHNVLILGPTGSGKSNLLHVMIQSLAELYTPDEVALYLIDGKYGTEFSVYANRTPPHARVVSLNSETAFGLSVLAEIHAEQERRGDAFSACGARTLSEYRERTKLPLPRIVLFLDEFQQLLSEEDRRSAAEAQAHLRDIARQGRAYGIHMVLATQTLKGVDLPSAVQQQIAIRIVLGRSPDGFFGVLSDDNRGVDSLERFQALKNTAFGHSSGNSVLQVAEAMAEVATLGRIEEYTTNWDSFLRRNSRHVAPPCIFRGSEPAQLLQSSRFLGMLSSGPVHDRASHDCLLVGEPIAMRDTEGFKLSREANCNVLLLARNASEIGGPVLAMVLSALTMGGRADVEIDLVHVLGDKPTDRRLRDQLAAIHDAFPDQFRVIEDPGPAMLAQYFEVAAQTVRQAEALPRGERKTRLFVILGLHEMRSLRDDSEQLCEVIDRGPSNGTHVICWSNSYAGLRPIFGLDRSKFGQGLLGKVDADDVSDIVSHRLIETRNRLLLFDRAGFSEERPMQVRPFASPDDASLAAILQAIADKKSARGGN